MSDIEKNVPVASLVMDMDYYPRCGIDSQRVMYYAECMSNGAEFPPVRACRKTKLVTDGFHRCRSAVRNQGPTATIPVQWVDYKADRDRLLDAIDCNARHGIGLDRQDRVRCALLCKEKGIALKRLADLFSWKMDRLATLIETRTAYAGTNGDTPKKNPPKRENLEKLPLKKGLEHLSDSILTKNQQEGLKKYGGMRQSYWVIQVQNMIDCDLIDAEDEELFERLERLHETLGGFLAKVG